MNTSMLEPWAGQVLGLPIVLEQATGNVTDVDWTGAELDCCQTLLTETRRAEWLRGRRALKQLLRRLGLPDDTSDYRMPHPRLSLSHSGNCALALGSTHELSGLGVDLEYSPKMAEAGQRFFLTAEEIAQLECLPIPEQSRQRVRLWSIKEAVFKADLANAGCGLGDYRLDFSNRDSGTAQKRNGKRFRFISRPMGHGFISMAICLEKNHVD